jgi:hypothetical protein
MGTYKTPERRVQKYNGSFISAVREFGSSMIGAREIELLDLEMMAEKMQLPASFFIANKTLDHAIEELREMNPDLCPNVRAIKEQSK